MANFLAILQIRMGDRLQVVVDLPAELAPEELPSMLLQPLVENAIKHGLEPKVEGGSITLQARRVDNSIQISVIDTGLGFRGGISNGIGLKNVRERIAQLYGANGSFAIEENAIGGTRAILTLPLVAKQNTSTAAVSGAFSAGEAHPR